MKILHDWLACFEENQFEHVRFQWTAGSEGLNPFLLDKVAEKEGWGRHFGAKRIEWRGCGEISLGAVSFAKGDVEDMAERVRGLKRVAVWKNRLEGVIEEEGAAVDGGMEWVILELKPGEEDRRGWVGLESW